MKSSFRIVILLLIALAFPVLAQPYAPPATHRATINLDSSWRFLRQDVAGAQNTSFDDSAWSLVDLPHTWNNLDGQDGGNDYYRGSGWYRAHCTVDNSYSGRHFFLKFEGSFYVTDVWLNGNYLGQHQGGFSAFVFDVTPWLNVGTNNVIAVKVSNAANPSVPPLSADFSFFGGLYRDVSLLVTDPVQISPLDYGSPGVYLTTSAVSTNSAGLQVTTVLSNSTALPQTVTVRMIVTDAATNLVSTITNLVTLPATASTNVVGTMILANPHLWNGLSDPYLYQTFVEVLVSNAVVDAVSQPLGFRWFSVDPTNGFSLNGRYLDLHGVNLHQDWLNRGWAVGDGERQTNFALLKEIGATALRLSHYEHAEQTYQLADQNGIILWSEIPLINYITESAAFYTNVLQQMREMIRQRYNHPAVTCWSLFNEITLQSGPPPANLVGQLAQLAKQEDPMRLTAAAANSSDNDPTTLYSDLIAFNKYYGWYGGVPTNFGTWADSFHATYPARCMGISEYGAGASVWQHSENPVTEPANAGPFHPEEYQNLFHEFHWQQMKARPFLWCKLVWNLCDFASDGRNEGDTPGRNNKGLVTYDRQIRKDAFYWYKANWTTNPMVYITGHTFTNRLTNAITAKIYGNCDSIELYLNGVSQGTRISTNCIFTWPLALHPGTNVVQAIGTTGNVQVSDSLIWNAPTAPPNAAITSPTPPIVFLHSTNDVLQLSATIGNNPTNGPVQSTSWVAVSGPGMIVLDNPTALSTTARFSAEGVYGLSFTAYNGAVTNIPLTVVVNPTSGIITDSLAAWWKLDEFGGSTASDSSLNGRAATITGAVFTNGYLANALQFNGTSDFAYFSSPDISQITVAGWVRADGHGNSAYPRILETPGYRLFFRFDAQGTNGLDFATATTANGDWFSGANTITPGTWCHVAASYDFSNVTNVPRIYVNGRNCSLSTVTTPSGTQPSPAGTGYIGNRAAPDRAWKGIIDDLRIYNRLLADAEIQVLATPPSANLAPIVNAGTNQIVIWPAAATLAGTVSDDGKPSSPGVVATKWAQVGGPGTVTFLNSNALATVATFSIPGNYQLRLIADDAQASTASELSVSALIRPTLSVQKSPGVLEFSWQPLAGNWQLEYQTNLSDGSVAVRWTTLVGLTNNPCYIPEPSNSTACYYRLRSLLQNP